MALEESCPYRGLASYGSADARYFFGRERLIEQLVSRLAEHFQRGPLLVVGPSGSGKSSLLRAGMLPALAEGALPLLGSRQWPTLVLTPGGHPLGELAARLAGYAGAESSAFGDDELAADPRRSSAVVRRALDGSTKQQGLPGGRLVLVIDQFEEVFTTCDDERERRGFIQALTAACGRPITGGEPAAMVVLRVRADFYGHHAAYPELIPAVQDSQVVVGAMNREELCRAIEMPAEAAGLALEPGLTELLLRDLGADAWSDYAAGRLRASDIELR